MDPRFRLGVIAIIGTSIDRIKNSLFGASYRISQINRVIHNINIMRNRVGLLL